MSSLELTAVLPPADRTRRQWLLATVGLGGALVVTAVVPFAGSMLPSERAKAAGAPVEIDIAKLAPGEMMIAEWRGKPIWLLHRTPEMMESLLKAEPNLVDPQSGVAQQPAYASNATRSIRPEIFVAIGICTHLGCSPGQAFEPGLAALGQDWPGGFLCPCHGSTFDLAGRVFKNKPAPSNLVVPPHYYLSETRLLIGEDAKIPA